MSRMSKRKKLFRTQPPQCLLRPSQGQQVATSTQVSNTHIRPLAAPLEEKASSDLGQSGLLWRGRPQCDSGLIGSGLSGRVSVHGLARNPCPEADRKQEPSVGPTAPESLVHLAREICSSAVSTHQALRVLIPDGHLLEG